jgi:hypothetical protein
MQPAMLKGAPANVQEGEDVVIKKHQSQKRCWQMPPVALSALAA